MKKIKANQPSKKEIYESYGVSYNPKNGKIIAPVYGEIKPLLINGNAKLGKGVYTWSTLPTNKKITAVLDKESGLTITETGTCPCHCPGCYATSGCYCFNSTKVSLAIKTALARRHMDFVRRAIIAQIKADRIKLVRIHCAGDFFSTEYIETWKAICNSCSDCIFWSYTKNPEAEQAFNNVPNCNIVKSVIHGMGFNFGKCGYIVKVYKALREMGKNVYICRCGIDPNQHCTNCKGCSRNEYVLFVEHSTNYKAELDPDYPELKAIVEAQAYPA